MKTTLCITVLLAIVLVTIDAQVQLWNMYANRKDVPRSNEEEWKSKDSQSKRLDDEPLWKVEEESENKKTSENKGNAKEQYELGCRFFKTRKYKEAFGWFEKSANQNYVPAQYRLASMYKNGNGIRRDYKKAIEWFEKSAEQGNVDAPYELGLIYDKGNGVKQSYRKTIEWFERAKNLGNKDAEKKLKDQFEKECLLYTGTPDYVREYKIIYTNPARAKQYEQRLARNGFPEEQFNLALSYYKGENGRKPDREKAIKWFEKSANQNYVPAQYMLALMYFQKKNYAKAFYWFEKSANQEYTSSQCNLGIMYARGQGVKQNIQKAFYWFEKSAQKRDWFEKSANQGWKEYEKQGAATAQYNLGLMYALGQGVTQNIKKACELFEQAKIWDIKQAKDMIIKCSIY